LKNYKVNKKESFHRGNHQSDSFAQAICVMLSVALAICAIVSWIFGNLAAAVLFIFFSFVFVIMSFKIRRVKLKAGPFEVDAYFK